jgi:hypothetical protein
LVGDALFYGLKNEISRAINERQLPWSLFVCFPGVTTHYGCTFTAR